MFLKHLPFNSHSNTLKLELLYGWENQGSEKGDVLRIHKKLELAFEPRSF